MPISTSEEITLPTWRLDIRTFVTFAGCWHLKLPYNVLAQESHYAPRPAVEVRQAAAVRAWRIQCYAVLRSASCCAASVCNDELRRKEGQRNLRSLAERLYKGQC